MLYDFFSLTVKTQTNLHVLKGINKKMTTLYEPKTYLNEERIICDQDFIDRNNLTLSRSIEDIKEKIKNSDSFFGFDKEVYIEFLDFENAKEFLSEEYSKKVESGETEFKYVNDIHVAAQDFLDYMNFAWGKAQDERGLSASRSVAKLGAWLWMMGRNDLEEMINDDDLYNPYGAPALIAVCKEMGIKYPESLDEFVNSY